jgi:N-acetyl-anhydromuramyl-L-alanine amidase AmpD
MELKPSSIKYLIVHHSATARDTTTFEAVKRYHVSKGWGDIGYHYFITADGRIQQGRAENVVGAQCQADGMNFKSLGICLTGNFDTETPTVEQLTSLVNLLRTLMTKYSIPKENVIGHGQVHGASTACPGNVLRQWVDKFKAGQGPSEVGLTPSPAVDQVIILLEQAIDKLKQL